MLKLFICAKISSKLEGEEEDEERWRGGGRHVRGGGGLEEAAGR
jgi:hypothetical protein